MEDHHRFLFYESFSNESFSPEWFFSTELSDANARSKIKEFLNAAVEAGFRVHVTCMLEREVVDEELPIIEETTLAKKSSAKSSSVTAAILKKPTKASSSKTTAPANEGNDGDDVYDPFEAAGWYEEQVISGMDLHHAVSTRFVKRQKSNILLTVEYVGQNIYKK